MINLEKHFGKRWIKKNPKIFENIKLAIEATNEKDYRRKIDGIDAFIWIRRFALEALVDENKDESLWL